MVPASKQTPEPASEELDEIDSALTLLARLRNTPRSYAQVTARAGVHIDRAAAGLLAALEQSAPVTPSELAERSGLDVSTVSRHVSHLEREGYVARAPHPGDARAVVLSPTPSGRRALDRLRRARRSLLDQALEEWSTDDVRTLHRLLPRLAADYEEAMGSWNGSS